MQLKCRNPLSFLQQGTVSVSYVSVAVTVCCCEGSYSMTQGLCVCGSADTSQNLLHLKLSHKGALPVKLAIFVRKTTIWPSLINFSRICVQVGKTYITS
jgi:hypothetical protein